MNYNAKEVLCRDLEHMWDRFRRTMQRGMIANRSDKDSKRWSSIGKERIRHGHLLYREMYITPSLLDALFGKKCCKVKKSIVF